ncbi:hypothetical protein IWZ01DRAFT_482072 [Phyllosticta capitalensis]
MGRSLRPSANFLAFVDILRLSRPQLQSATCTPCLRAARHASTDSLPRVAQPSLWQNLVPKPFRRGPRPLSARPSRFERLRIVWRNPATVFIAFGLMIGSNAINLLLLRNSMANYSRKADAKIALLKEVFERVQRGEEVDVEGLLGTGNEQVDKEWEEALKEIEEDERAGQSRKRRKANSAEAKDPHDSSSSSRPGPSNDPVSATMPPGANEAPPLNYVVPPESRRPVQFL